jgi:hypothetical protein
MSVNLHARPFHSDCFSLVWGRENVDGICAH